MGLGVEPYGLGPLVDHASEPLGTRLLVVVFDRAARLQDLVGAHGGIAHKDQSPVSVESSQDIPGLKAFTLPTVVGLPKILVWAIVKIKHLEVAKLAARRREELLDPRDVVIHAATDVQQHQHLHAVVALWHHPDVKVASVACRFPDGVVQIQLQLSALARKAAQTAQGDLEVADPKLNRVIVVPELALVPHLDRRAIASRFSAHTDTFRMVATISKRGGATRPDPSVSPGMTSFLFLQALFEHLHELVPAVFFKLSLLLWCQPALKLLDQPVQRDFFASWQLHLHGLVITAKGAVESVKQGLVLDQCGAGEEIEILKRWRHERLGQRLKQGQILLD